MKKKYIMFVEIDHEYRFYYLDGTGEYVNTLRDIDMDRCPTEYIPENTPKDMYGKLLHFDYVIGDWCLPTTEDCIKIPIRYHILNRAMDLVTTVVYGLSKDDKDATSKISKAIDISKNMVDSVSTTKELDDIYDLIDEE